MNTPLLLDCIELQTQATPRASLIVLHGLGADGRDFVPVCQALDLQAIGGLRCVLPNAPQIPVTLNGGYRMPAWYDILGTQLDRREDEAGLRASQAAIAALIDRERERGIAPERIVLMGFSQGCAMALMTGLRYPQRLAGIVGLSGYLPLLGTTEAERHAANAATPIFLAHGRQDPVVAMDRGRAGRDELLRLGYAPKWHEYAMQHEVCNEEIEDLNRYLIEALSSL